MSNESKGNKRRNRRRYRIRYDRIAAAVLGIIILIVLITSCAKGIMKSDDDKKNQKPEGNTSSETQTTTQGSDEGNIIEENSDAEQTEPATAGSSFTEIELTEEDIHKGDLILINNDHMFTFPEGEPELKTIYDNRNEFYNVNDMVNSLTPETIDHINSMMGAFCTLNSLESSDIYIIDGYHSYEKQADRYANGSKFPAGYSDYHSGRSFDMGVFPQDGSASYYFDGQGKYEWFTENAMKYGFIVRYPQGKSEITGEEARERTYRYVGVPHSVYMQTNGLTLEEYIDQIKSYTPEAPLEIAGEKYTYNVYYVPAAETGSTKVPVPENVKYTVSGNNFDGFIVTVTIGAEPEPEVPEMTTVPEITTEPTTEQIDTGWNGYAGY